MRVNLSGLRGVGECERGYFRRVAAWGCSRCHFGRLSRGIPVVISCSLCTLINHFCSVRRRRVPGSSKCVSILCACARVFHRRVCSRLLKVQDVVLIRRWTSGYVLWFLLSSSLPVADSSFQAAGRQIFCAFAWAPQLLDVERR